MDNGTDLFSHLLTQAVEAKQKFGEEGLGKDRQKFNYYMPLSVHNLACELSLRHFIDPKSWAAWMCNTELDLQEEKVVIRVPSAFIAKTIIEKFGSIIRSHYQKPVFAKIDLDLDRYMKRLST